MKYTYEEIIRFAILLEAFGDYLHTNPFCTVIRTHGQGYLALHEDGGEVMVNPLESSDELFALILNQISFDVRDLFLCGEHTNIILYPSEIEATRKRVQAYLDPIPAEYKAYYTAKSEDYLLHINDNS